MKFSGLKEPPRIEEVRKICFQEITAKLNICLLYTSDAADD